MPDGPYAPTYNLLNEKSESPAGRAMSATLRTEALRALAVAGWEAKLKAVQAIDDNLPLGADDALPEPPGLPGRPARPELVPRAHGGRQRSARSPLGRAILIHSLAHIEFNAVNLALDAIWRFPGQPRDYYLDWLRVAREEAYHFSLLNRHLGALGHAYGDFPAHNGLWEMAEKTRGDLLARLALVPRTLEARGWMLPPWCAPSWSRRATPKARPYWTLFCATKSATWRSATAGSAMPARCAAWTRWPPMPPWPASTARRRCAAPSTCPPAAPRASTKKNSPRWNRPAPRLPLRTLRTPHSPKLLELLAVQFIGIRSAFMPA